MITRSTVGKLMIEDALPEEMRGRNITFDKKNMSTLLKELADKHPDKYIDVTKKLSDIGRQVATETGGYSIGLSHLKQMAGTKKTISEIRQKLTGFLADTNLNDKQRNDAIIRSVGGYQQSLMDDVYKEGLAAKNPIAMQIMSGSRGNKMNLSSLLGSDLLYEDHRGDIIPVPVLKSYSQGLTPAEYWAGTYGARKSIISTKFATADAGFFGKQLNQVTHRLSVVDQDDPRQDLAVRGLPVDTDDMDNEGALLAHDFGGYKRNTVLTPKILKDLKARKFDRILVRSPMTGGSPDGGVYARDVGVRERGTLPGRGEMVGMTAAQAIAEPISQGQLSAKHSGGVAGQEKTVGGFQYINQLIQVPKTFKGGAAHTTVDGRVQKIEDAPAGGKYVFINDKPQYVGSGFDLKVKPGDDVEAGDIISDGMPNPSIITEHKGIGEGRKYFVKAFRDSMGSMGLRSHRRNIELIGRGLIDHVRMTEEYGDHVPDDVIPYSTLEHGYKPREGFQTLEPSRALNKYLEKPVLHYSIGTKVRPGMLKDMQYFGVKDITVHDKPAPFQPEMVRAMYNLHHDPDWMTRMYGSGLKSSLLDATHRGSTSSATGTSFVPGLAKSVDFGRVGQIRQSEPGLKPDLNTPVATPMTPNTDTEKLSSANLYHGSSLRLNNVEPRPSRVINNEAAVFGTPNRELALSFMAPWTDADLSLGSTNNEPYVLEERYPGAFEKIYKGKSGFLHHLPSADFAEDPRLMPTERIARKAVKPANIEEIKNLWDALQTSGIVLKRHGDKSNNKVANDDILPGGIGDKYNVSDFPKKEMAKGVKTESEHTTNPAIAADITKDHLVEDPKYYTKLEKVEKKSAYSIADGIANVRRKDDTLSQLLEAKKHSDAKRYDHKNAILRKLMQQSPQDWRVDDTNAAHYGVTHVPTSFRLHTDPNVIPAEVTRQKQSDDSAIKPSTGSSTNPTPSAPKAPTAPAPVTAPMSQPKAAPAPAPAPAPMQQPAPAPAPAPAPMQQPPAPEPAPAPPQQQPAAPAGDEYFAGMGPYEIRLRKGMSVDQIYDTMMANPAYKVSDNPQFRHVQERHHRTRAETYHRQLTASNGPVRDININTPNFSFKGPTLRPASPITAQQPTSAPEQSPAPATPQQTTPTPVQSPPPITPQQTTPITDAPPTAPPVAQQSPAPQPTPITNTPAQSSAVPPAPTPPAAPSSAYTPPAPIYGKQDDSILPEAKKQQSFFGTPEESFKTINQAIEDVSILTGVGRTDPNINWNFDAIGASDADTGALQESEAVRLQQQAQEEVKNQVSKKIQEDQKNEMDPKKNRFTDTSTPMGVVPSLGLTAAASMAVDSAKQLAGAGTAAAAAPQAAKAVLPAAAETAAEAAAKGVLPAATEAAVPMTTWLRNLATNTPANALKYTTETASALKSAPLTTLATGAKNTSGLVGNALLFPLKNPLTNVAIDAVMTAVENRSAKNIAADSDAWGDWANYAQKKLTDAQGELVKGNVLNFLGGTAQGVGSLGAMAAQAVLQPARTAQTAMYSSMMAPRNSEEGVSQRRNWAAQDKPDLWKPPEGSNVVEYVRKARENFQQAVAPSEATQEQKNVYGDMKYKGLPGFTGYENIQKPSWAANIGMDWLLGNKTKERVPTFATPTINPKAEEDTRQSLALQDTVNSMAIHQKQKFITDLIDGIEADKFKPDPNLSEADKAKAQAAWQQEENERQRHIQDTMQRLPIATQIELRELYAARKAGAIAEKPTFVEERPVTAASKAYDAQQAELTARRYQAEQRTKNREIVAQSMAAAREHDKEMERQRAQRQMDAASGWTQYGKTR